MLVPAVEPGFGEVVRSIAAAVEEIGVGLAVGTVRATRRIGATEVVADRWIGPVSADEPAAEPPLAPGVAEALEPVEVAEPPVEPGVGEAVAERWIGLAADSTALLGELDAERWIEPGPACEPAPIEPERSMELPEVRWIELVPAGAPSAEPTGPGAASADPAALVIGLASERWIGLAPPCEAEPPTGPVVAWAPGELTELVPIGAVGADVEGGIAPLVAFGWGDAAGPVVGAAEPEAVGGRL